MPQDSTIPEQAVIMIENAFGPDGFGLEWVLHEWLNGELDWLGQIAQQIGRPDIAAILSEADVLQIEFTGPGAPGDTRDPRYAALQTRAEALEARLALADFPGAVKT